MTTQLDEAALLPCPFCEDDDHLPIYDDAANKWEIACWCGAAVRGISESHVIKRWNTRALSSRPREAAPEVVDIEALFRAFAKSVQDLANETLAPHTLTRLDIPDEVLQGWLKYAPTPQPQMAGDVEEYAKLDAGAFLSAVGMDGKKWADAFMEIWGSRLAEVDHGLMIGWFCNAIMAGYDEAARRSSLPSAREVSEEQGGLSYRHWQHLNWLVHDCADLETKEYREINDFIQRQLIRQHATIAER